MQDNIKDKERHTRGAACLTPTTLEAARWNKSPTPVQPSSESTCNNNDGRSIADCLSDLVAET